MLDWIKIDSFKSITEETVELGQFNVLIGPNGSGKSNLLEAIGVLGASANGRVDDESLLRRGVRPGVPALYKSSFTGSKMKNAINLSAGAGSLEYRVGLYNPSRDPRPAWSFKTESFRDGTHVLFGRSPHTKERLNPFSGLLAVKSIDFEEDTPEANFFDVLQNFAIYSPNTATLRGLLQDPQSREPVGLNGGRLAEAYLGLLRSPMRGEVTDLRKELVDWVSQISVGTPEYLLSSSVPAPRIALTLRDKYMAKGRDRLTAYDASEGALYVLFSLVLCLHESAPKTLAIDNFDFASNPLLARRLAKAMCESLVEYRPDHQIIVTAHNPLVLDGLPLLDDRVRLFTVSRAQSGRTVVRRVQVTERMMEMVTKEGWTLSRMWITGHLGGVPDL